jgi:phosphatidylserine decarboxylase
MSAPSLSSPIASTDPEAPRNGALREGAPLIAFFAALGVLAWRKHRPSGIGLLGFAAWTAWFFRDPVRHCPAEPDTLYAAADGRVMAVEEVDWDWFIHGRALRIVTFLSPLDVHVNRCPVAAQLVAARRDTGSFLPAFLTGGSESNARQLLGFEVSGRGEESGRLVVAQIVGVMARRIVSWRWPGDRLAAGEKIGMIRFGSRTDVLVPAGAAVPLVSPGDTVHAAITPLARYTGG